MRQLFIFFSLLLIASCTNTKAVYWCGDHPCINKKEREAYFKKTLIVEVRELDAANKKSDSDLKKITEQALIKEKKRIKDEKELSKQAKLEEKRLIKEEKELAKQAKLEEKRRIKEEKKLAKQIKIDEKKRAKENKKVAKKSKVINKKTQPKIDLEAGESIEKVKLELNKFDEIVKKIINKNSLRPYPDINDIPN